MRDVGARFPGILGNVDIGGVRAGNGEFHALFYLFARARRRHFRGVYARIRHRELKAVFGVALDLGIRVDAVFINFKRRAVDHVRVVRGEGRVQRNFFPHLIEGRKSDVRDVEIGIYVDIRADLIGNVAFKIGHLDFDFIDAAARKGEFSVARRDVVARWIGHFPRDRRIRVVNFVRNDESVFKIDRAAHALILVVEHDLGRGLVLFELLIALDSDRALHVHGFHPNAAQNVRVISFYVEGSEIFAVPGDYVIAVFALGVTDHAGKADFVLLSVHKGLVSAHRFIGADPARARPIVAARRTVVVENPGGKRAVLYVEGDVVVPLIFVRSVHAEIQTLGRTAADAVYFHFIGDLVIALESDARRSVLPAVVLPFSRISIVERDDGT